MYSSIVLSNATPYKTFMVRRLNCFFVVQKVAYLVKGKRQIHAAFEVFIIRYFSPVQAYIFLAQGLVRQDVLPDDFLRAVKNSDYNSV